HLGQMAPQRVHIRLRLLKGDSGFEPAHRVYHAGSAVSKSRIIPLTDWNVHVAEKKFPPAVTEIFRDHAHHGVHRVVQLESLAHSSGRRSESAFPQSAANQHYGTRTQLVLLRKEHAAEGGFHTQQGEETRRHHLP